MTDDDAAAVQPQPDPVCVMAQRIVTIGRHILRAYADGMDPIAREHVACMAEIADLMVEIREQGK